MPAPRNEIFLCSLRKAVPGNTWMIIRLSTHVRRTGISREAKRIRENTKTHLTVDVD